MRTSYEYRPEEDTQRARRDGENEITSDGAQLKQHAADSYERHSAWGGHDRQSRSKQKITGINARFIDALLGPHCVLTALRGVGEGEGHCARNESTKEGRIGAITPLPPPVTVPYHPTTLVPLSRFHRSLPCQVSRMRRRCMNAHFLSL